MRTPFARACLATLVAGILVTQLSAQDRKGTEDSAAKTLKLVKPPETPADFWDAVKFSLNVGKPDDAAGYLDRLLASNPPPELLLMIREKEAATYFPKLATAPELQAKAIELLKLINQAEQERARDPQRIQTFINYLTRSPQHRAYGIAQLRSAGPDAVPHLLSALKDPAIAEYHSTILLSMQKLDTSAVPPLVDALATEDRSLLIDVIQVLSVIGDRDTVPHLRYFAESSEMPAAIQSLAREAVERIQNAKYADLPSAPESLVAQAVAYYEHRVDVRASSANVVRLWHWTPREGLKAEEVSASYAEEFFGLGHCRQALALDPNNEPAQIVQLSLAMEKASQRAGIDQRLPAGPGLASAAALAAGPELLGKVLVRALDDGHPAVALAALQALARTGDANLLAPQNGRPSPLVQALSTPDPRIPFAAAEAVLSLRSQQPYPSITQVVPILARALTTSGTAKALVVDRDPARGSVLASLLREVGYEARFLPNSRQAFASATESADYELIFLDPNIHSPELSPTIANFRGDPRTAGIPIIVLGEAGGGSIVDPLRASLQRGELTQAIEELRKLGDRINNSKLDKAEKQELLTRLSQMGSTLQAVPAEIKVSPSNRAFLAVFSGELRRFSREVGQTKSDKDDRAALVDEVLKLNERIDRLAVPTVERYRTVAARESLPTYDELRKFERRYARVKAFLRPATVDDLKLQLEPLVASLQSKPLTAAERADYARRAAAWLARIARGEIRGIDLRPAEPAVLSVLADDTLGPDAIAAASLLPSAGAQTALAKLAINDSANMPLRIEAATQISQSLRQFGVLMPSSQVKELRELLDRTAEPTFHQALASAIGATKPRTAETGQRLRRMPTPSFQPGAEAAEEPAVPEQPAAPKAEPTKPAVPAEPPAKEPTEELKCDTDSKP